MIEGLIILSVITTIITLIKAIQFSIQLDEKESEIKWALCKLRIKEQEMSVLRNANENLRKEITRFKKTGKNHEMK